MNSNLKKIFTMIMFLLMVISLFSITAFAEQNDEHEEQKEQTEDKAEEEEEDETEPEEEEPDSATGIILVRYVDEDGVEVGEAVVREYNLGEHTFEAKSIPGYNLISPVEQSVTLSEDGEQKEVIFQYRLQAPGPESDPDVDEEADTEETQPEPVTAVEGISLVSEPYKTTYFIGDELELGGLVVYKELSDGKEEQIPMEDLTVTGFNSEEVQEGQVVTIGYNGFNVEFTVNIEEERSRGFLAWVLANSLLVLIMILLFLLLVLLLVLLVNIFRSKKKAHKPEKTKEKATKEKKVSKKRKKRAILIIPGVLVALILFAYIGALYLLGQMERKVIAQDDESLGIAEGVGRKGITNITIFGIDAEDGMTGRSDAIMILTLDEITDKIKITSLMRDSYVHIPGRGMDKINHAYAFGGPELALKTINQNFKLDSRHYVSVNFTSMPAIIEAVGGVEVKVTDQEAREIPGISSGGTYVLNGEQALSFSRIRKIDSDFARTRRQRDIMESGIVAALNTPATSYPAMLTKVFPHLTTNLTSNQILNLGRKAVMSNINTVEQAQFPPSALGQGQMINGVYYYVFDQDEGARRLSQYIYHDEAIE